MGSFNRRLFTDLFTSPNEKAYDRFPWVGGILEGADYMLFIIPAGLGSNVESKLTISYNIRDPRSFAQIR